VQGNTFRAEEPGPP